MNENKNQDNLENTDNPLRNFYFIGNKEHGLEKCINDTHTDSFFYQYMDFNRCYYAAVQTLLYLLRLKGLDINANDIQTCYLWLSESQKPESIDTWEDTFSFFDKLYTKLATMVKNKNIPSFLNKTQNSLATRDVSAVVQNLKMLGKDFNASKLIKGNTGNMYTVSDFPCTLGKTNFTLTNTIQAKDTLFMDKFILHLIILLLQILVVNINTDVQLLEVVGEMAFYITFGLMSSFTLLLSFGFLVNNKEFTSKFLLLLFTVLVFVYYNVFSHSFLTLDVINRNNLQNSWKNIKLFWYNNTYTVLFGMDLVFAIIIVIYTSLYQTKSKEFKDRDIISSKMFTFYAMVRQQTCRSIWMNNAKFETNVVPMILHEVQNITIRVTELIGYFGESPIFLGHYMKDCYSNLSQSLKILPSMIPITCVFLFHILFQNQCNIHWPIFLCHMVVFNVIFKVLVPYFAIDHAQKICNVHLLFANIVLVKNITYFGLKITVFVSSLFGKRLLTYPYDNLLYNPYTAGISYVYILPLFIIFLISRKLCQIYLGKVKFQKERTKILSEAIKYHDVCIDNDFQTQNSLLSIHKVFCDLWRAKYWCSIFLTEYPSDFVEQDWNEME